MTVTLQFIVEIGMGVEVNDGEVCVLFADGPQDGIGNRMVAAQADWPVPRVEQVTHCTLDSGECGGGGKIQVTSVGERRICTEVEARFAPHVGRVAAERL